MKRAGDRVEITIKVHSEDGQVYIITNKDILQSVREFAEAKIDKIDWKQEPHQKDPEDSNELSI